MGMPNDLILVRHGESEGNIATEAAKSGDMRYYTDTFTTTPGRLWRLTAKGREQAAQIGRWVEAQIGSFERYYVSPYVRTRETAGNMNLDEAAWMMNRALRERDWGDIGSMPREEFVERYPENAWLKRHDPLYWVAPGGESIAQVAEDRVRNVLSTMHRECDSQRVIAVSHGELMWAFRLVLERWDDEEFGRRDGLKSERIRNCQAIHYTRTDPETGEVRNRLSWVRTAYPDQDPDGSWVVRESGWSAIGRDTLSNDELLASVELTPHLFKENAREQDPAIEADASEAAAGAAETPET